MITRRMFNIGFLMTITGTAMADDPRYQGDIIIHPNSVIKRKDDDIYSFCANDGSQGEPESGYNMNALPGLQVIVFLPPIEHNGNVIVFSHGEQANPIDYRNILKHWASHGFIVLAPYHNDRRAFGKIDDMATDAEIVEGIMKSESVWQNRIDNCHQIIDALQLIQNATGYKINAERPIIAGHSLGAWTAQMMVGMRATNPDTGKVFFAPQSRYYACLAMSPQGIGVMGLDENSWQEVNRPVMFIGGEGDENMFGQKSKDQVSGYYLTPPHNKNLIWFDKIWSSFFIGNNIYPGTVTEFYFRDILAITTCFIMAYSKYDKDMFEVLTNNYFEKATNNRVAIAYR